MKLTGLFDCTGNEIQKGDYVALMDGYLIKKNIFIKYIGIVIMILNI